MTIYRESTGQEAVGNNHDKARLFEYKDRLEKELKEFDQEF